MDRLEAIENEIRNQGGPNKTALRYFNTSAKRWMDQCRKQEEVTGMNSIIEDRKAKRAEHDAKREYLIKRVSELIEDGFTHEQVAEEFVCDGCRLRR